MGLKQRAALAFLAKNFGHCYVLGGNWPGCSDCSGTTLYVYKRWWNVVLPHYTVTQFKLLGGKVGPFPHLGVGKSKIGEIFTDERMALPCDLVFRDFRGFSTPDDNPDHVGLHVRTGVMRDTRSPEHTLADRSNRDGNTGSQTFFGRVYVVNGPVKLPAKKIIPRPKPKPAPAPKHPDVPPVVAPVKPVKQPEPVIVGPGPEVVPVTPVGADAPTTVFVPEPVPVPWSFLGWLRLIFRF